MTIARHVEGFGEKFAAAIGAGQAMNANGPSVFSMAAPNLRGPARCDPEFARLRHAGHAIRRKSGKKNRGFYLALAMGIL